MAQNESALLEEQKKLIRSEDFERALSSGSERNMEIDGTLKSSNRSNYDVFYDIMLRSRNDIQSILDKKKKDRTPAENELLAAFKKGTSAQYKQVKEMIFIDEDESLDEDGVSVEIPKKASQLVERLANVVSMLRYLGHSEFENELGRRGIKLSYSKLEDVSDVFSNDAIHSTLDDVFKSACSIQKQINDKKREIVETVFELEVPKMLQYDKDTNPSGIKPTDFNRLVQIQTKKIKAQSDEAKDKVDMQATNEAENKHCDSIRSEILREKYMSLMEEEPDDGR